MIRIKDDEQQPFESDHVRRLREVAAECAVLLKSDGSFPLAKPCGIALYGSGARHTIKGGTGSGDVNVRHFATIEEGLQNAGFEITSQDWLNGYDAVIGRARGEFVLSIKEQAKARGMSAVMMGMGQTMAEPDYSLALDAKGEAAVYVLSRNSGEGADRKIQPGDIALSETEVRDILEINQKYEKFMLVLNTGGMVELEPVKDVRNILLLGQLGTVTGDVLADILLGKSFPSGKLAMTWAPVDSYCSTEGFGDMDDTFYKDGVYVGYRYFDSAAVTPDYAFGYGLGYTTFAVHTQEVRADGKMTEVRVRVQNTGSFRGKETVQVYVSTPWGKMEHPYQELRGFAKTKELQPEETQDLWISFATADLASYDTDRSVYMLECGTYVVRVGCDSASTIPVAKIHLPEPVMLKKVKPVCTGAAAEEYRPQENRSGKETIQLAELAEISLDPSQFICEEVDYTECCGENNSSGLYSFTQVCDGKISVESFVGSLTNEQLAYLTLGYFEEEFNPISAVGASAVSLAGGAGETTKRLGGFGVPSLTMADGPAGIRVSTAYKLVGDHAKAMTNPLENLMIFLEPEELEQMAAMSPRPTQEELDAPVYYQYCTAIPIGTSLAQAWNPEICRICGDIVGEEMEQFGVHFWLAPAMNIQRSPLCGRNFEYFSEDPLLGAVCAAAVTEGVQGHKGCAVTLKHFACNNQETNRYGSNSAVSERALREIYLRTYEFALRIQQPHAIMSSYNLINGEHTCNSHDLINAVLRDEWAYEGVVMTDWYSTQNILAGAGGRKNKYAYASAAGCIHAGNDLVMPGGKSDLEDILSAIDNPSHPYPITRADLQACAGRILMIIQRLIDS